MVFHTINQWMDGTYLRSPFELGIVRSCPALTKINRQSCGMNRNVDSEKCGNIMVDTYTNFGGFVTLPNKQGTNTAQSAAAAIPLGVMGHEQFCVLVSYQY